MPSYPEGCSRLLDPLDQDVIGKIPSRPHFTPCAEIIHVLGKWKFFAFGCSVFVTRLQHDPLLDL